MEAKDSTPRREGVVVGERKGRAATALAVPSEAVTRSGLERLVTREEFRDSVTRLEKRLDAIEYRINRLEERIDRLEGRMDTFMRWMVGLLAAVLVMLRVVLAGG